MNIVDLSQSNSVLNAYIAQIRDKVIQKDSLRFRTNLERMGEIFAYEISKTLNYKQVDVETPLGIASCSVISDQLVLSTILRAGLPLHQGLLNVFDNAQCSFVAAYRKYGKDNKCTMSIDYCSSANIEGKVLILADTMVATGNSISITYQNLLQQGEPTHTHIVCAIASRDAVEKLSKDLPHKRVTFWVGAIDEELTNKCYIVPGLGDAGDLAFGTKG